MAGKGVLKGCLIAVVVVVLLVVAIVFIAFKATSGIVDAADDFFAAAKSGNMSAAHGCLSEEFRQGTSIEELQLFLKQNGLGNVEKTQWSERSIENDQGTLSGSATTATGGTVPLTITLVKENGAWRIHGIKKPAAGIRESGVAPVMPDERAVKDLVKRAMHDFATAVNADNFVAFHAGLAPPFREQFTAEQLLTAFKAFCDKDIDLTVLDNMDPVLDEKTVNDENGVLAVKGHYDSTPSKTHFDIKFLGAPDWKIMGINVQIK